MPNTKVVEMKSKFKAIKYQSNEKAEKFNKKQSVAFPPTNNLKDNSRSLEHDSNFDRSTDFHSKPLTTPYDFLKQMKEQQGKLDLITIKPKIPP